MSYRFTIIDRSGTATPVDEPTGFDANTRKLQRDLEYHGMFLSDEGYTYEFDTEPAVSLLKMEYSLYGIEGNMKFKVEEDCSGIWKQISLGQFNFEAYSFECDGDCVVKIPVEIESDARLISSRKTQKVDLNALLAFDGTTALPAYAQLGTDLLLPSKAILLKDSSYNEIKLQENIQGVPNAITQGPYNYSGEIGMVQLALSKEVAGEIGGYFINSTPVYQLIKRGIENGTGYNLPPFSTITPVYELPFPAGYTGPYKIHHWPGGTDAVVNWADTLPNFQDITITVKTDIRIKGRIKALNVFGLTNIAVIIVRINGNNPPEYLVAQTLRLTGRDVDLHNNETQEFDSSYTNPVFQLRPNDLIYAYVTVMHSKTVAQAQADPPLPAFHVEYDTESFWKMEYLSKTLATNSKVFLINEAISRIVESISNNTLKAYSEYYGRTDSQPYAQAVDGCGGLRVITDGIRIRRQENRVAGQTSVFSASVDDIWQGLMPIDNIGFGIEPDPQRLGFNRFRVENWQYFYQNNVVFTCNGVNKLIRKVEEKELYNTFSFGYAKWEAEEYNGIDEFLTKRVYRTSLANSKNELAKLSKWIASAYAIEVTRRKGTNDSKDWRYDKDTFVICVVRQQGYNFLASWRPVNDLDIYFSNPTAAALAASIFVNGASITVTNSLNNGTYTITSVTAITGGLTLTTGQIFGNISTDIDTFSTGAAGLSLAVELGNVLNPANIIDPATIYNYRLSPLHNALKWMNRVFESYRQFNAGTQILFTDGDGNYFAEGQVADILCRLEAGVIKENQTINIATFAAPGTAKPFLLPERVVFDYPVSSDEYQFIEANKYGLIAFDAGCDSGEGWIDNISYKSDEQLATFTLIPKAV